MNNLFEKYKKSNLARRLASGALWTFSGTAIAKILVLVSGILCAHILGKTEYGELGMVRSTVGMFAVLGTAGLGVTATKYIAQYKNTCKEKVASVYKLTNRFALIAGSVVTTIILLLSDYLATEILKAPHLVDALRIGGLMLFVSVINGAQGGTLYGFEDFKSIAINTLGGSVAEAILMLLGAYYYGVFGALLGFGSGYIVLYVLNYFSIKRDLKLFSIPCFNIKISKEDFSLLYNFSLPALLSSLLVAPTLWVVKTILVNKSGFEELANFEAADYWKVIILYIPYAISTIILPILSDSTISDDKQKYWRIINVNIALNGGLAFICALVVTCLSNVLVSLFGVNYSDNITLIILAFSTVFTSIGNVVGLSLTSKSLMWQGFGFNVLWAVMTISFSYISISYGFGSKGVASSILLSYFIHAVIQLIYLNTHLNKHK